MEINQIVNADCIDILKGYPDHCIDAIVTDPPYLNTHLSFDKKGFDLDEFLVQSLRVLKQNGYLIMFGGIETLGKTSNHFPIRWTGVWLKSNPSFRTATAKKPKSRSEFYAVFAHPKYNVGSLVFNKLKIEGEPYKKIKRKSGYTRGGKDNFSSPEGWTKDGYIQNNSGFRWQTNVIEAPNKCCMKHKERTNHPTQKPVKLMKTLIEMCTNENQLILDPFAGSFSTAIACLETNRNYICIEKETEYFLMGENRINEWKLTSSLHF